MTAFSKAYIKKQTTDNKNTYPQTGIILETQIENETN